MNRPELEANLSTLILSFASSAAMSLGLAPDPSTKETKKDLKMAQFNIEMLKVLKEKTSNNRTDDESQFLDSVIADLQMKFVQSSSNQ